MEKIADPLDRMEKQLEFIVGFVGLGGLCIAILAGMTAMYYLWLFCFGKKQKTIRKLQQVYTEGRKTAKNIEAYNKMEELLELLKEDSAEEAEMSL